MNEQKLNEIIVKLLMVRRANDLSSTDDTLLEVAGKIYISESINESKKENIQAMKEDKKITRTIYDEGTKEPKANDWRSEPITNAQEDFFLKRKIAIKKGMTKGEASPLIDEIKKRERQNGQI